MARCANRTPNSLFPSSPARPPLIVGCQMPTLNKGWQEESRRLRRGSEGREGEFQRQLDRVRLSL